VAAASLFALVTRLLLVPLVATWSSSLAAA
jgi:hypothetical protein